MRNISGTVQGKFAATLEQRVTKEFTDYSFMIMSYSVTALTAQILIKDNPNLAPIYAAVLENTKLKLMEKANLPTAALDILQNIQASISKEIGITTDSSVD